MQSILENAKPARKCVFFLAKTELIELNIYCIGRKYLLPKMRSAHRQKDQWMLLRHKSSIIKTNFKSCIHCFEILSNDKDMKWNNHISKILDNTNNHILISTNLDILYSKQYCWGCAQSIDRKINESSEGRK